MTVTSAAEANLDARIRPAISAMRAHTSYPRRRSDSATQISALAPATSAIGTVRSAAARPGQIQLTRRGRTVLGILAAIGVLAMTGLIWLPIVGHAEATSQVKAGRPAASSVRRIVVMPGETLWGIAVKFDHSVDPRVVIPEIVDLNSLSGTGIQIGQVLLVPRN